MPDPWTDAWAEAAATAPPGAEPFATLEMRHVGFIDGSGHPYVIRLVSDTANDQTFTLEAGAASIAIPTLARDGSLVAVGGGGAALFVAVMFRAKRPEVAEGKLPTSEIVIDNVARETSPSIRQAMTYRADLIIAYREYRSDDLTEPAFGPVELVARSISMNGTRIAINAGLENLGNRKFPSLLYDTTLFPGLLTI